ncbi:gp47 [Lomovskayavirus C31]|uniref:Gp47 n=1 Tax=Streptomyces phage phiC31 TaxID=10719 RepID=Q9ZXA1_BPPHC|nr:gp47 [Lomovskayavirus C31]CAA07117.1 gp47 [Lomovskayavirus C31]
MAINANALSPSLVTELNDLKRRLAAVERKPDVLAKFDRYPPVEWSAIGRGMVSGNVWSSCGLANVTGLVFDRVEAKFITDRLITGRSEAEVRLAAFKHDLDAGAKVCLSASSTIALTGTTSRALGTVYVRWLHGIPFGWDAEDGAAIYTIELQHRYREGPTPDAHNHLQVYGFTKRENVAAPDGGALGMPNNTNYATAVLSETRPNTGIGWTTVPDPNNLNPWDGSYNISNMHYCVGLPEDRIPTASTGGHWRWRGTNGMKVRDADITEDFNSS